MNNLRRKWKCVLVCKLIKRKNIEYFQLYPNKHSLSLFKKYIRKHMPAAVPMLKKIPRKPSKNFPFDDLVLDVRESCLTGNYALFKLYSKKCFESGCIWYACESGCILMIRDLFKRFGRYKQEFLYTCIEFQHFAVVDWLLQYGADLDFKAVCLGGLKCWQEYEIPTDNLYDCLKAACIGGNRKIVRAIVKCIKERPNKYLIGNPYDYIKDDYLF